MDIFHEMKKYRTGKTPEGNNQFNVPLQPDEDGMIGRECPNDDCQPKYFKISMTVSDELVEKIDDFSQTNVTCPYCGSVDNIQHYLTEAQLEWVKSMMFRDVAKTFQNMTRSIFKPSRSSPKSMFSVSFSFKPGSLPSVRHYVEEKLKQIVECDSCKYKYAVYGISFHCPLCGEGNLAHHLKRSSELRSKLIEESERISNERGEEAGQHMLGNALEDTVSLFETFLKHIYQYEIKKKLSKEDAESKIKKIRNTFQRIEGAEQLFKGDLGIDLYSALKPQDKSFLEEQFLKRHVLTHNLGLVDKKYQEKAKTYERQGAELEISEGDVKKTLSLVTEIVEKIFVKLSDK